MRFTIALALLATLGAVAFSACAVQHAIANATYPDYYEVEFVDHSKTAEGWFCIREPDETGVQRKLECIDAAKVLVPEPHGRVERAESHEPDCSCMFVAPDTYSCECQ